MAGKCVVVGELEFGIPYHISPQLKAKIDIADLWHPTRMWGSYLEDHGAEAWAFLGPEEHPNGSHGGFAFQLNSDAGDQNGSSNPCVYFPIVEA